MPGTFFILSLFILTLTNDGFIYSFFIYIIEHLYSALFTNESAQLRCHHIMIVNKCIRLFHSSILLCSVRWNVISRAVCLMRHWAMLLTDIVPSECFLHHASGRLCSAMVLLCTKPATF